MRFTRLTLENWRNFRAVDVPLAQRVFIVGPNASGKSNLLDAIRFLRDIADRAGGLRRAVDERRGMGAILSVHAPGNRRGYPRGISRLAAPPASPVRVEVHAEIDGKPWRYGLCLGSQHGEAVVVSEEVDGPDGERVRRPDLDDQQDPELLTETHLEQISVNKPFRKLAEFFASVEYTHIVPELVRQPRAPAKQGARRDPYGADLLESMRTLPEAERVQRLALLQRRLAKAVPQLEQLLYAPEQSGTPHLAARFVGEGPLGFHREDELSDGTLRLLGLLWVLGAGASPLLLEEPEMSLHAAAVRQIPQMLARAASRMDRQILVSTHSEEMLSDTGIDPSEILILTPTDEGTRVSVGSDDPTLVALAREDTPLSGVIVAKTSPKDVEQLSYALGDEGE